jgi:hypothetical protein
LSLRIAFDLDGVLADMEGELIHHAEALFGAGIASRVEEPADQTGTSGGDAAAEPPLNTPPPSEPAPDRTPDIRPPLVTLRITARQQRRLWRHVEGIENFWESLSEIEPGAVGRLASLASRRRWEVMFLTRRPNGAGATAQVQTQRWLEAKGFPLPSVYVVQHSRGRIAAALGLDFVIDDRPENCLDVVVDSRARAVLVWRQDQQQLPAAARRLGIGVVGSVAECLDLLAQVDIGALEKPKAIDRVMRLLGLKQPAGV